MVGGREDVRSSSTSTESSARNGRSRGTVAGRMRGRRRGERLRTRVGARVAASCTATSARGTAGAKKASPRWSSARRRRWTALASERGMRLHGPWCGFGSVQGVGAVPALLTGGDWRQCSCGGCSCGRPCRRWRLSGGREWGADRERARVVGAVLLVVRRTQPREVGADVVAKVQQEMAWAAPFGTVVMRTLWLRSGWERAPGWSPSRSYGVTSSVAISGRRSTGCNSKRRGWPRERRVVVADDVGRANADGAVALRVDGRGQSDVHALGDGWFGRRGDQAALRGTRGCIGSVARMVAMTVRASGTA